MNASLQMNIPSDIKRLCLDYFVGLDSLLSQSKNNLFVQSMLRCLCTGSTTKAEQEQLSKLFVYFARSHAHLSYLMCLVQNLRFFDVNVIEIISSAPSNNAIWSWIEKEIKSLILRQNLSELEKELLKNLFRHILLKKTRKKMCRKSFETISLLIQIGIDIEYSKNEFDAFSHGVCELLRSLDEYNIAGWKLLSKEMCKNSMMDSEKWMNFFNDKSELFQMNIMSHIRVLKGKDIWENVQNAKISLKFATSACHIIKNSLPFAAGKFSSFYNKLKKTKCLKEM